MNSRLLVRFVIWTVVALLVFGMGALRARSMKKEKANLAADVVTVRQPRWIGIFFIVVSSVLILIGLSMLVSGIASGDGNITFGGVLFAIIFGVPLIFMDVYFIG
jgi:hypothetical protein